MIKTMGKKEREIKEKKRKKENYTWNRITLLYSRHLHSIVNQLHCNKTLKNEKKFSISNNINKNFQEKKRNKEKTKLFAHPLQEAHNMLGVLASRGSFSQGE